jgi:TM2 domain-containing membrane protein YozV
MLAKSINSSAYCNAYCLRYNEMTVVYKNKTFAALIAALLGSVGLHRFYLHGTRDRWGWLHAASIPLSGLLIGLISSKIDPAFSIFLLMPLLLSALAALLEALLIGLTPDTKWDDRFNVGTGRNTASTWPLAVILVFSLAAGMGSLIFLITRTADLFFTGGSYG